MARNEHKRARDKGARAVGLAGIAVAVLALAGCEGKYTQSGTSQGRPVIGPFQAKGENPLLHKDKEQTAGQEMVEVTVWRITIKNQEQKRAEELWKLFKPARLVANNAELLGRNGLAISSTGKQNWTEVEIGLSKQGAGQNKVSQTKTWLVEGYVGEVAVSSSVSMATLFWHEGDGDLVGKTYENCRRLLVITAAIRPSGQIQIKLVPALKEEGARVQTLRRLAILSGMKPERYMAKFERLAFEAIIRSNDFLIVGSGAKADDGSFGRAFFDDLDDQQPSRTVLLIIPRMISSGLGESNTLYISSSVFDFIYLHMVHDPTNDLLGTSS